MSVSRTDWDLLVTEYKAVKKQLSSKKEALSLFQQQIVSLQEECANYKAAAEAVTKTGYTYTGKQEASGCAGPLSRGFLPPAGGQLTAHQVKQAQASRSSVAGDVTVTSTSDLESELSKLTAEHNEVVQEKRALQRRLERLEAANKEKGVPALVTERDKALKERNELVQQLEQARNRADELKVDVDSSHEELEEAVREKGFLSAKCDRLNKQLLQFLQEHRSSQVADSREFIDIDAILVENKYLKERLAKSSEEKQELVDALSKHKPRVPRLRQALKNAASDFSHSSSDSKGTAATERTVHTSSGSFAVASTSSKSTQKVFALRSTIADLQAMVATLSDSLRDRNTALQHSKTINKTLAQRVLTLERQLGGHAMPTNGEPASPAVLSISSPSLGDISPSQLSPNLPDKYASSAASAKFVDMSEFGEVTDETSGSFNDEDMVEWQRDQPEADRLMDMALNDGENAEGRAGSDPCIRDECPSNAADLAPVPTNEGDLGYDDPQGIQDGITECL